MSKPDSTSDNESIENDTPGGFNPPARDEVLSLLEVGLREAHRKVESGRVYDAEAEKVRQGWIRVLGYIAGQYRQLKKDEDLEELAERMDALEDGGGFE